MFSISTEYLPSTKLDSKFDAVNVSWGTTQVVLTNCLRWIWLSSKTMKRKVSPGRDLKQKLRIIRQYAVKPIHWQIQMTEFMAYPARKYWMRACGTIDSVGRE